jgi:type I restriction enzyme S subunit
LPEHRDLPHVSGENIESRSGRLLAVRTAGQDGVTSGKYLFAAGALLYSKLRPYLQKVAVADFRGLCSADMYPLSFDADRVCVDFAKFVLLADEFTAFAVKESDRARMPKLNREQLLRYKFPLPPLAEQRRLAARLTAHLAVVERARSAADARVAAAEALPAAYLREAFEGLADDCPRQRLAELADIASGITLGRRAHADGGREVPYLRVANVQEGGLRLGDVYTIRATEEEIAELRLRRGDLVMTEGGDRDKLGRGTWWDEELPECIHQNHIFRVRFRPAAVDHQFFGLQLRSAYVKGYFLAHAKQTTGIATINRRILGDLPVLLPPLADQRRIAAGLSARLAAAERLAAGCRAERQAVAGLPPALLRQAFPGDNSCP